MSNQDSNSFSDDQLEKLKQPLLKEKVKTREGTGNQTLSYLPSFHIIDEANRIFGFGQWDHEIITLREVDRTEYEKEPYKAGDPMKKMISISYLCTLRVTVKCGGGVSVHEDTGFGNGVAGNTAYGKAACIELSTKEAVSDAMKRCLRVFGDQFGLSLYDKDANQLMELGEYEASKLVTEDQLKTLRDLYVDRDIDDEWVMALMKGENYPGSTLEEMRQDWYLLAIRLVTKYKLAEIKANFYEEDIVKVIALMKESATINMLKAVFTEAWRKATEQNDKERLLEIKKIYDELKAKFESEEKK